MEGTGATDGPPPPQDAPRKAPDAPLDDGLRSPPVRLEPVGAPGLGEVGPHSPGADVPPAPPRPPDARDLPRLRLAGRVLVLVGLAGALLFGYLAVTVAMALAWHGDAEGGGLEVEVLQGPSSPGSAEGAVVRVEDLHGDWTAEGVTQRTAGASFDLPHAHARVTIQHEGRTWQREVFVPEGGTLLLRVGPDDPATSDAVVGRPLGAGPFGLVAALGLATAAFGFLVLRRRALHWAVLWSACFGVLGALQGTALLLFAGNPLPLLLGLGLLWSAWAVQRGRRALAAQTSAAATPAAPEAP